MTHFIQTLISGLSLGSIYALIALGYTMVYGIAKMLNFAHGDIFMVSGLVMVYATTAMPLYLSIPLVLIGTVILGFAVERMAYKPLRSAPRMSVMISAIGVSYFIQNMALYITGGLNKNYPAIPWISDPVRLFGMETSRVTVITPFLTIALVIALVLLINHWLGVPASVASPLLDAASYALAFKFLGWDFLLSAGIASVSLAGFYRLWECLPPMLPDLTPYPLAAALLGGAFVGIGVGLIVRQGGSSGGDDALALVIHKLTGWKLSRAYLFTDLTVLLASLSYIPVRRIAFSLVTVTVSSLLIDWVKEYTPKNGKTNV